MVSLTESWTLEPPPRIITRKTCRNSAFIPVMFTNANLLINTQIKIPNKNFDSIAKFP